MNQGNADRVFAPRRAVSNLADCHFYHTVDLPALGRVSGEWDLRDGLRAYLGGTDVQGKRVLDIGTATGFLAFSLEQQGAEVVGYDLSDEDDWDLVPYAGQDLASAREQRRRHVRRVTNGFWLCHAAFQSHVRLAYGSVYQIPRKLGEFDVSILGCLLLHLRDPFRALEEACRVTRETVIVIEPPPRVHKVLGALRVLGVPIPTTLPFGRPSLHFLPHPGRKQPTESWWRIPPRTLMRFLAVLGFARARLSYHAQRYLGKRTVLYTVVARRSAATPGPTPPPGATFPGGQAAGR